MDRNMHDTCNVTFKFNDHVNDYYDIFIIQGVYINHIASEITVHYNSGGVGYKIDRCVHCVSVSIMS